MQPEIDAGLPGFLDRFARVAITGFQSVGYQDHARRGLDLAELINRLFDCGGNRRLALRVETLDAFNHGLAIERAELDQRLDIRAVSLAAVTVGQQTGIGSGGQVPDQVGHDLLGHADLGGIVDAAPHAAGSIQYEKKVSLVCAGGRGGTQ